jgi:hypothetical protein
MTVGPPRVAAPPPDELEALIREARARQRRRRLVGVAALALVAALGLAAFALVPTGKRGTGRREGRSSLGVPVPRCRTDQLRVTAASTWNAAAGSLLEPFTVTNVSNAACSVAGWPAVRLIDATGRTVPTRSFQYTYSEVAKVPFHPVTVRPGAAASFNYFAADWDTAANRPCPNARKVQVRLPAARDWISVALTIPACGTVYIDPVVSGRTDRRWGGVGIQHFSRP